METVELEVEQHSRWFGMTDCRIGLKESRHTIELKYVSEPPHGDSYHELFIDGKRFCGFVWGCNFLFPIQQTYMVCSWMSALYERKTVIIHLNTLSYHVLDTYWHDFREVNGLLELGNNRFQDTHTVDIQRITSWIDME